MIIRSEIKSNFTCIPNAIFTDDRLTRKAKCLLLELLSKPENWNINYKYLVNSGKEGEHAIRAGINELIEAGYIHKEIPRQKGKISKTEHYIYDRPMTTDEHRQVVGTDHGDVQQPVTPPEEYLNHQGDLFQADEPTTFSPPAGKEHASQNLEIVEHCSNLSNPSQGVFPNVGTPSQDIPTGKNHMVKVHVGKTAPIINTDNKQILRGTTATAPAREVDPIPQAEAPKQPPQSYPATSDVNFLLDLIPERFSNPMTDALIKRSLSSHTANEIADAVIYSVDNVKGGKMQFKAYLDKCLRGGFAEGYQAAREVPESTTVLSSFGAMGAGRYPNGSFTGNSRTDSNLQAAAMFLQKMGVQG